MNHWLVKTEPGTYSWDDLVRDKRTAWTGVRNFLARNMMRQMKEGDAAFVYHSGAEKAIKGIAKIVREAYSDEASGGGSWSVVDIAAVRPLARDVTLDEIKGAAELENMVLVKNSRLSVQPVTEGEWEAILALGS